MLTGGSWWTERIKHKTLLHCVLKLPQEVATAMVANSGEHGIFAVRWETIEPTRRWRGIKEKPKNLTRATSGVCLPLRTPEGKG